MFAPLRRREAVSPEVALVQVLQGHQAGATAAALANELLCAGLAVGSRGPVTDRIAELLDDLEQAQKVQRIPDGRYRAVRAAAKTV